MNFRRSCQVTVIAVAVVLLGCGEKELPAGIVAQVEERPITQAQLGHAMIGRLAPSSGRVSRPYQPGDVEGCIAAERRGSDADLDPKAARLRCSEQRDRDQRAALRLLIQGRWYALEAKRRGMAIPTFHGFARVWGTNAGVDPKNMYEVTEFSALRVRLVQNSKLRPTVSDAEARRYYLAHREHYAIPEDRRVEAVRTRTRAQADRAAALMSSGHPLDQTVRRSATSEVTLPYEGAKSTSELDPATQRIVRRLRVGGVALSKRAVGWSVLRLQTVTPPRTPSFEEARVEVMSDRQEQEFEQATKRLNQSLREKYGSSTLCARDHDVPECG